jgi:ElaB/YqjD/DUF883 family membrane-anchored ribosome-binding protein
MAGKFDDKRINEALELLNELAKEKAAELQDMIGERYGSLKSALGAAGEKGESQASDAIDRGKEKATELVSKVDENVRKNPWPYIGGTALGFLILGFFLGKPRK